MVWGITLNASQPIELQAVATATARIPLVIVVVADATQTLTACAEIIKRDISFTQQFIVSIEQVTQEPTKAHVQQLFAQGYQLALFLSSNDTKIIEWRLYDTLQGKMNEGKRYAKRGNALDGWAHNVADAVWVSMTGNEGFFSTKIAYCKEIKLSNGKRAKNICMADYDGLHEQLLVSTSTVNVAPRWNHDMHNPLLFYSEYTNSNVRLVAMDMHKNRRVTSNFDGINMLPSFSSDGSKVAYCASRGDGNCQLYFCDKNGFRKITHNEGNNVSPALSADGSTLIFCSDYETGRPQLYRLNIVRNELERLTEGGYCASPSYCPKRHQVAYSKMVKGTMQLFLFDEHTRTHTQLTSDEGNKEECCWSPCGNYLLFSCERGEKSRLVLCNMITQQRQYITPAHVHCSYPTWSISYALYPTLQA
jgi:TolB protein